MSSKSYTHVKMPNLLNHLYNGNGAISPELVEAQPHLVKNVLKGRRPVSKVKPSKSHSNEGLATEYVLLFQFWMLSMILDRTRPKASTTELEDVEMPLDVSQQNDSTPIIEEVCLLRDSPFRIFRVSGLLYVCNKCN